MPDTLADRLGLWEPCPECYRMGLILTHPGSMLDGVEGCPACSGTGRVLNPAAVRAAWAMVEDADKESWQYRQSLGILPTNPAMTLALLRLRDRWTQELEAAGAERPKEVV